MSGLLETFTFGDLLVAIGLLIGGVAAVARIRTELLVLDERLRTEVTVRQSGDAELQRLVDRQEVQFQKALDGIQQSLTRIEEKLDGKQDRVR